jgi:hypothetical protein
MEKPDNVDPIIEECIDELPPDILELPKTSAGVGLLVKEWLRHKRRLKAIVAADWEMPE